MVTIRFDIISLIAKSCFISLEVHNFLIFFFQVKCFSMLKFFENPTSKLKNKEEEEEEESCTCLKTLIFFHSFRFM